MTSSSSPSYETARAQLLGFALALLATVIWSGNFVISRGLESLVPPVALSFWRWTTATAVILPVAFAELRRDQRGIRAHWGYLVLCAFLGVALMNTLIYVAGHSTRAINLSLLATCSPIFIIMASPIVDGVRITRRKLIGVVMAAIGVLILLTQGSLETLRSFSFHPGDIWMLSAALTFAAYTLLLRRRPPEIGNLSFTAVTFTLGTIMLVPAYAIELFTGAHMHVTEGVLSAIAYVGILASIVAFLSWNAALKLIDSASAALIYYFIPVFSSIAAIIFLGERVHTADYVSAVLVIGGVILGTRP
ncbi:MAG TPA: DMT family transporter [Candidatus Baltobacteraceae bacterium]|jgi:drug/metabolite transporter (DMT)-like permease|nr:DMT family transporter [Candidatus Baltobacteraceae bacterium]